MTDPIASAAKFIEANLEWCRHKPWVDEFLRDVAECATVMRGIAAGPRERMFLGECGAKRKHGGLCGPGENDPCFEGDFTDECDCWCHRSEPNPCETQLYGKLGAAKAKCRTCGAEHDQDARIAERTALAHSYRYTAAEIADAYPGILANTITKWHGRGLLADHGDADGQRLYEVADVLALAESSDERWRQAVERRAAQAAGMGA